jgi:hypothetical protein
MSLSQIHRQRFKRMQELAMKFSPDEDIGTVIAKCATEAQPKAGSETLSLRAQKRVRQNAHSVSCFLLDIYVERADIQTSEIEGET